MTAEVLPARDVRPRPPGAAAAEANGVENLAMPSDAPESEPEGPPDFSTEGIRRHIQERWAHRPFGVRYARWEAMLGSFASRMAARIASENEMEEPEPAAEFENSAGSTQPRGDEAAWQREAAPEAQQQSEHEVPGAGKPQNLSLEAAGSLGRE